MKKVYSAKEEGVQSKKRNKVAQHIPCTSKEYKFFYDARVALKIKFDSIFMFS